MLQLFQNRHSLQFRRDPAQTRNLRLLRHPDRLGGRRGVVFVRDGAPPQRESPPARELRDRWETLQFERLSGGWRSYREVLSDSLAELAGERGWRWNSGDCRADIGPAQRFRMQTAWVNRHDEPAPGSERPDHEWRDLWPLAGIS